MIFLDKHYVVYPVGVGEIWRRLLSKCLLRVTRPEATNACQNDQLCDRLKAGIDCTVHEVRYIWESKSSTEDWVFLLVDEKTLSTRSIELKLFGQFSIYGRPELIFLLLLSLVIASFAEREQERQLYV